MRSSHWLWIAAVVGATLLIAAITTNWGELSATLKRGSEATAVALFRAGELPSIAARLKERYGERPEISYEVGAAARRVTIFFRSDPLQESPGSPQQHADEIARSALAANAKPDDVDEYSVRFEDSDMEPFILRTVAP